jgi:hypothetical protein
MELSFVYCLYMCVLGRQLDLAAWVMAWWHILTTHSSQPNTGPEAGTACVSQRCMPICSSAQRPPATDLERVGSSVLGGCQDSRTQATQKVEAHPVKMCAGNFADKVGWQQEALKSRRNEWPTMGKGVSSFLSPHTSHLCDIPFQDLLLKRLSRMLLFSYNNWDCYPYKSPGISKLWRILRSNVS